MFDNLGTEPGRAEPRQSSLQAALNKLPKSLQSKARRALQEIRMAETKKDALMAFDAFGEMKVFCCGLPGARAGMKRLRIAGDEDAVFSYSQVKNFLITCRLLSVITVVRGVMTNLP